MFAQYNLGYLYEHGQGVALDYAKAYKWYELAEAQGHPRAPQSMDALARIMTLQTSSGGANPNVIMVATARSFSSPGCITGSCGGSMARFVPFG